MQRRMGWLSAVVAALILSACGSSGGSTSPTPAAAGVSSSPAPVTAQPVVGASAASTTAAQPPASAPIAGTSAIDPCSLITQGEATAALGVEVKPAVTTAAGPSTTCLYQPSKGYGSVTVTVVPGTAAQIASIRDATSKDLSGIGDEAVLVQGGVWIRKGSTVIAIIILTTEVTAGSAAAVETLARAAGSRL